MVVKTKNESIQLNVDPLADIFLTVTIGNGQIGGSIVKVDSAIVAKGDINRLSLGKGKDLAAKPLHITTNIMDTNDQTQGIVVTYSFQGCTPVDTEFSDKVDNPGDIFSWEIDVTFN